MTHYVKRNCYLCGHEGRQYMFKIVLLMQELKENKNLKEMTLEDLWLLFPIIITPHNSLWMKWADEEIESLHHLLKAYNPIINHIGSTAIPEIQAKPIIDILIELPYSEEWNKVIEIMETHGYIMMAQAEKRLSFNKGYTLSGYAEKVFHIHFHEIGDRDEIIFRNYLIAHPDIAKEYESLKLSLLPRYRNNRDGYTKAKTDFIKGVIDLA